MLRLVAVLYYGYTCIHKYCCVIVLFYYLFLLLPLVQSLLQSVYVHVCGYFIIKSTQHKLAFLCSYLFFFVRKIEREREQDFMCSYFIVLLL